MNRVDLNWVLQFRVDGLVKPSRLKEIWALCIMYMYFDFIQCTTIVTRALPLEGRVTLEIEEPLDIRMLNEFEKVAKFE